MFDTILTIVAGLGVAVLALGTVFVLGMRTKSALVVRPLFAIMRRWLNPYQLRRAGRPGAYASIIRHRGRRTGRPYETPVGVVAYDDDFLVMLPYGSGTQWLRNVLADGEATLVTEGRTVRVDRPEIIPFSTVAERFSASDRRSSQVFAVRECLLLRHARSSSVAAEPQPDAGVVGLARAS
ncbi:MAG TPA: nitroreductase family deazaflavin-dependent oxidoreductase [Candidatus Limnocylindrales bacterium]|nr:nitroreductase family deazaflavin-dependent oxidoreductase [Candidatus Limnocylindrales bacterium]